MNAIKTLITLLILVLATAAFGQQIQYVKAENGLIVRESPDKNSQRIGKLEYGTRVKLISEIDIELTIKDGAENISGKWTEIQEIGGDQKGFVFNGYLTPKKLNKRTEIKFQNLSLQMEIEAWDEEGELKKIHGNTATVFLELGDTPEGKKVKINQTKFKKIEVFQRHENSVTIMNEGPHCDLTEWKHYYSEWKKVDYNSKENTFVSASYNQEDWGKFSEVDINELKKAVEKECGAYWAEHIKNIENVYEYPSGVSMSRIFFKIVMTDKNDAVTEKIISFEIPMGC